MNLTMSAHHMEITDAIREYALSKMDRVWSHFAVISTRLTLKNEKGMKKVQAEIGMKGQIIHVEETHADLYAAIDLLVDAIHVKLAKQKDKGGDRKKRVAAKRDWDDPKVPA